MIKKILMSILLAASTPAFADDVICTDRPGSGSAACIIQANHTQAEFGNDSQEIRYGIIPNLEISLQSTVLMEPQPSTFGVKLNYLNTKAIQMSSRFSTDRYGDFTVEFPSQINLDSKTNISVDPQIPNSGPASISVDLNRNVTSEISFMLEYARQSSNNHINYSVMFIPTHDQTLQFDLSYVNHKILAGISKRF